jgi:hypothetical protein
VRTWEDLRAVLQEQGNDRVPEEVLVFYRQHFERFGNYLNDLERLRSWALAKCQEIDSEIGGRSGQEPGAYRKAFAAKAVGLPLPGLVFAALDGRLDIPRLRNAIRSEAEAREALAALGLTG